MNIYINTIKTLVKQFPAVVPHLTGRARWIVCCKTPNYPEWKSFSDGNYPEYGTWMERHYGDVTVRFFRVHNQKTYDYYLQQLERLIRSVYDGNLGGEFIDVMANLISGQLTQAFEQAWRDEEGEGELPDYLSSALEDMILGQYDHVDSLYRDIVDARVDETPIEPLLSRAVQWANQWNAAYNEAQRLINIENGGNLMWNKGNTEHGCSTCANLDGIVLSAREWEELDVHPQGYPNPKLECEGGGPGNFCDCTLSPTDQRRTPKGFETVLNIVSK